MEAVEARYGQVFSQNTPDPRTLSIIASDASSTLDIEGAYLNFQDLTIHQARRTIRMFSGAHHVTFDGVTVWVGDTALEASGSGVHDIRITSSRFLGDNPQWIFWSDMKDSPAPADYMRAASIRLMGGTYGWEISHSLIRGSGQDLVGTDDDEDDIVVHHSRLENCGDDAFEIEGTTGIGRVEIYENYISNCLVAVAPGQDSPHMTGPLLVYRNIMSFLRNPPVNRKAGINSWNGGGRYGFEYLFKHGSGSNYSTQNTHYYHNTIVMLNAESGLNPTPRFPDGSTAANNLFVMINGQVVKSYRMGADQIIDGNLYWKMNTVDSEALTAGRDTVPELFSDLGIEAHGIGDVPMRGTDPRFATLSLSFESTSTVEWALRPSSDTQSPEDFALRTDSPAAGAGIALPSSLPDTQNSRDIGAIPVGASLDRYRVFPFVP